MVFWPPWLRGSPIPAAELVVNRCLPTRGEGWRTAPASLRLSKRLEIALPAAGPVGIDGKQLLKGLAVHLAQGVFSSPAAAALMQQALRCLITSPATRRQRFERQSDRSSWSPQSAVERPTLRSLCGVVPAWAPTLTALAAQSVRPGARRPTFSKQGPDRCRPQPTPRAVAPPMPKAVGPVGTGFRG